MEIKRLSSEKAPKPVGSYSAASLLGELIFTSGQLPLNPETNDITGGIEEQARQSLTNVKSILESNDSDFEHILKTNIYLQNISDFKTVDAVYKEFFSTDEFPSRTAYAVGDLPMGALVEIEVIATTK